MTATAITPLALVLSLRPLLTRGSLAQTLHDRNAQAGLGNGFRNDQVETRFVKATHGAVKIRGGFPQVLLAAEILDAFESLSGL